METTNQTILIEKLRKASKDAEKKRHQDAQLKKQEEDEKETARLKEEAKKLCDKLLEEKLLFEHANRDITEYPIIKIGDRIPIKNKKHGYKKNLSGLYLYVFEELENRGFPIVFFKIYDWSRKNITNGVVASDEKDAYYLGISWK